ncbi:Putative Regulator of chromosome condensation [Podospora comata]|uniref:Regulator of chromosome condensation n=1 Tax=Podospora comata TaxID=48703 RepID=A0ABY6S569_PODCO|nr:Putative Regulator of chromosome condensation [Podospora comata]
MMDGDRTSPRRSSRKRSIIYADPANASRPSKKPKTHPHQQAAQDEEPANTPYLRIYCLGSNDNAELGLGPNHRVGDVRVPTLNPFLSCPSPSEKSLKKGSFPTIKNKVVQLAVGGMHCAALTSTNEILTWGVNDNGALGRDTSSARLEEHLKNLTLHDDNSSTTSSEPDINPLESTPHPVPFPNINPPKWTQITACDSATFLLSTTGQIYGWGCTRSSQGVSLFTPQTAIQRTPLPIPLPEPITKISARGNHILALTKTGQVYTWGLGSEQGQLGRRLPQRGNSLLFCAVTPRKIKLKNIIDIAAGPDHSFAVGENGEVWAWGLDNYAQTGALVSNRGEDAGGLFISTPTRVTNLEGILNGRRIKYLTGGNSHSLCLLDDGSVYSWGRLDSFATGVDIDKLTAQKGQKWEEEFVVRDGRGRARIVTCPVRILPLREGENDKIRWVEAGAEHGVAVTVDGRVVTWGFNASCQTGHRGEAEEIKTPRVVGVRKGCLEGVRFGWTGAGGHFTVLGEEVVGL